MKSLHIPPYIISLIFLFSNSIAIYSENLISDSVYQSGISYDFNHVFSEATPLHFSLIDSEVSGKWSCALMANNENMIDISVDALGGYCNFDPRTVPFSIWQEEAFRTFNSLDNRDEFTLYISFHSESGESDIRSVRLALLPYRPTLNNIQFEYSYDWEYDQIYPDGTFSFDVEAKNSKSFFLHLSHSFLSPSENVFFSFVQEFKEEEHTTISYDADWGEYVSVSAQNDFGFVSSDTLYTTDYILDENIINRINEILNSAGNPSILDDTISFSWDNEIVRFDRMPQHLNVYSLDGRKINVACVNEEINLSNMKAGVYIISYYNNKINRYITHKILKK